MHSFLVCLVTLLAGSLQPCLATTLVKANAGSKFALTRSLSLQEVMDISSIVFRGKFIKHRNLSEGSLHKRELTFEVTEFLAGKEYVSDTLSDNGRLKLYEWAALHSPFVGNIKKEKDYVFFFNKPSRLGLTSLTGFEQGLVKIDSKGNLAYSLRLHQDQKELYSLNPVTRTYSLQTNTSTPVFSLNPRTFAELKELY